MVSGSWETSHSCEKEKSPAPLFILALGKSMTFDITDTADDNGMLQQC